MGSWLKNGARKLRACVLALVAMPLAACGLQPVYAPQAALPASAAAEGLAGIEVALIPERSGQLLRNALQERFERSGLAVPRRYELAVSYRFSGESIGIQQDYSATRIRFVGQANYALRALDPAQGTLTTGLARVLDGANVFNQQFFALDQETETVQRRVAEAVADQIALQLALYFHQHPPATAQADGAASGRG